MLKAWRIVKRRHAAAALDGEGARLYGGRWNSPGVPVVYASETRALATLEVLVGIRTTAPLAAYALIPVEFDEALVHSIQEHQLSHNWRESPPTPSTQRIGDEWAATATSVVLSVPSVIIPPELNYLLNHRHPDFSAILVGEHEQLSLDPRLIT